MKTKEELTAIKNEIETLNTKLAELNEEELAQVLGGSYTALQADVMIELNRAGVAVTQAKNAYAAEGDQNSAHCCSDAQSKIMDLIRMVDSGTVPWNYIKQCISPILDTLSSISGDLIDTARKSLEYCQTLI